MTAQFESITPITEPHVEENFESPSSGNALSKCVAITGQEARSQGAISVLKNRWPKFQWITSQTLTWKILNECRDGKVHLVIFSAVPPNQTEHMTSAITRLRRHGYRGWIAVGYWRFKTIQQDLRRQLKLAGRIT